METIDKILSIAGIILVGIAIIAGILYLYNRLNRFVIPIDELANLRRHYKPSLAQLIIVTIWAALTIALTVGIYTRSSNDKELVLGLLICLPVMLFLLVPDSAVLLRGSIRIENGKVSYHSGWRLREFTLDGITSCRSKGYEVYEIGHRQHPGKPILVGNNFAKFYEFILICRYFAQLNNQPKQQPDNGTESAS